MVWILLDISMDEVQQTDWAQATSEAAKGEGLCQPLLHRWEQFSLDERIWLGFQIGRDIFGQPWMDSVSPLVLELLGRLLWLRVGEM